MAGNGEGPAIFADEATRKCKKEDKAKNPSDKMNRGPQTQKKNREAEKPEAGYGKRKKEVKAKSPSDEKNRVPETQKKNREEKPNVGDGKRKKVKPKNPSDEENRVPQTQKKNRKAEKPKAGDGKRKKVKPNNLSDKKNRGPQTQKKNREAEMPKAGDGKSKKEVKDMRSTKDEKNGSQFSAAAKEEEKMKEFKSICNIIINRYGGVVGVTAAKEEEKMKEFKSICNIIVNRYEGVVSVMSAQNAVRTRVYNSLKLSSNGYYEMMKGSGLIGFGPSTGCFDVQQCYSCVLEVMIELSKEEVCSKGNGGTDPSLIVSERTEPPVKAVNKPNGKLKKFWKGLLSWVPAGIISAFFGDPISMVVWLFCALFQGGFT